MKPPDSIPPPPLIQTLRELPRPAWVLFAGTFVNKFGTFVMPFLALYLTKAGYTMTQAGIAVGALGAGHFCSAAIGGYLADLIGRRKTITLSMALAAVFYALLPFAGSFWWIVVCTFFAGLTAELYRPAASALLADLVPPEDRIVAYSAYRLALNAGWALGPATAGLLARYSYLYVFIGEAVTCALFGVLAWFALPKGVRSDSKESGWGVALRRIRNDSGYLRVVFSYLGIGFVLFQVMTTFGVHVREMGFSETDYGMFLSLNGVLIVILELPITSVTRRVRAGLAVAFGYSLIGLSMVVLTIAKDHGMIISSMVLLTFGEMISFPVALTYVANRAPANMRGPYMGTVGFVWSIALIVAPWTGLKLLQIDPALLWGFCAVAATCSGFLVFRIHKLTQQSEQTRAHLQG
jgi:MFS family permease